MDHYLEFYNLKEDPFRLTPDPDYYYPSQEHVTALLSMEYCMEHREGFCCVTGEPGTGKTTILRIFLNVWQERAEIALIMTPRLSPEEFLRAILEDLNVPLERPGKNEMLKAFRDFLLGHAASGRSVAIVVDEAQNLPDETLEELRLLSNLETDKAKLLQIILIGQPELSERLQSRKFKQLNQRITVRTCLNPLSQSSTADYIKTRLIKAGHNGNIFDEKGLKELHLLSEGIPRMINIVATRALMVGFLQGVAVVGRDQIVVVGDEINSNIPRSQAVSRGFSFILPRRVSLIDLSLVFMGFVVLIILTAGFWREFSGR